MVHPTTTTTTTSAQQKQEQQLVEFVHDAQGFSDTNKDDRYDAVHRALLKATKELGKLSRGWLVRPGLSRSTHRSGQQKAHDEVHRPSSPTDPHLRWFRTPAGVAA